MSGLSKLIVDNFQSHEHTEVSFGPGLNVIVGPSDFGKSALVRALRWLFYNEPRGANFIRVGANSCRVTVELENGAKITRLRNASGKNNQYVLQRPGEQEMVFEGFNNEIPLEILQASEIRKVQVDERNKVELNFGGQLEGPFLLSENGAVRAKVIGQLGGVHILDWAQRSTGTDLRRLREEDGQLSASLASLEAVLDGYAHLPALEANINSLEQKLGRIEAITTTITALDELQRQWREVSGALSDTGSLLAALASMDQAEDRARDLEAAFVDHRNLSAIASELSQVGQRLETARDRIAALARLGDAEQRLERLPVLLGDCLRLVQLEGEIAQTAVQLERAGRISDLTVPVPVAEELWQQAEEMYRQWSALSQVSGDLSAIAQSLQLVDHISDLTAPVSVAEELRQQAEELCLQWSELRRVAVELSAVTGSLQGVNDIAARTEHLEQAESCLTSAGAAGQGLLALRELGRDWEDEDRKYQGATLAAERYEQETGQLLSDYRRLLAQLGRCPVCFGELTPEAVERALSEYQ